MPTLDARIDAYLPTAPAFALPIVQRLREAPGSCWPGSRARPGPMSPLAKKVGSQRQLR